MAFGVDGLVSNLDTTSLINQLMSLEARPQTLMKSTVQSTTSYANDLRAINSQIASIATAAKNAAAGTTLKVFSASSSATSVTAAATSAASAGSLTFKVDQTAQSQVTVSKAMSVWPDSPPVLTIVGSDGTQKELTAASSSMADIAAAITKADAGVTASAVPAGFASDGTTQLYRLQLTATESGAKGAFTVYRGAAADIGKGGPKAAVNLGTEAGAATVSAARDASITLWSGTTAAQTITSATNTFAGVLPGLDITVTAAEAAPVTVTVAQDAAKATSAAGALFTSLINVFSQIASKTAVTTTGSSTATTGVKGSIFTGDATVRQAKNTLLGAATEPVDGASPSSIGIKITRTGTIEFDSAAFGAALKKDPAGTAAMLETIAARIEKAATAASDSTAGYITARVKGSESQIASLNERIANWDLRLASRKETLQKQYTALETALGKLQSQSTWLASQLGSLMGGTS
jgi:flagellar hook-associated protein 2